MMGNFRYLFHISFFLIQKKNHLPTVFYFWFRFGDFAVGAPFEDNGAGVVILYFGRKDIEYIDKKEIIKASPGHMGFGASFSKKYMDIDNNQLSDLAIGSYMSGRGDS